MCINNIKTTLKNPKTNKRGLIEGYKVFFKLDEDSIVSPYKGTGWVSGWNFSDRVDTQLTLAEEIGSIIPNGFYIFLNKAKAMVEAKDFNGDKTGIRPYFVRKVWFKPEHLVCVGSFSNGATKDAKCAVVTKLLVRFD